MKKTILAIASVVLLGGTVSAQTAKTGEKPSTAQSEQRKPVTPEERAKRATDHLNQKVTLSKEQSVKVYEIELAYINQRSEMRAGKERTDADQEKMRELHKRKQESIKAILTADQLKKLEEANKSERTNKEGLKPAGSENHTK